MVKDLQIPDAHKKRLLRASQTFDLKKIEPVDCYEVATREEGKEWILQRHNGADEGRGIVGWSPIAGSRFHGRYPALQAHDFVIQYGNLTDQQKELISGKFPLTTLDRLLATPDVRTALGFDIVEGKLTTALPAEEAIKPLRRIVLDLAEKKLTVTDLKKKSQQIAYVGDFQSADRADFRRKTGAPISIEKITEKDFGPQSLPRSKKVRAARALPRIHVVPRACKLNVTNAKIQEIYEELRTLLLSRNRHAIAVLLRVFLETSIDHFLKKEGISITVSTPNGEKDKSLRSKVQEGIEHLVSNGTPKKEFIGVTKGLSDANHPFSPDTLNAYIHNAFYTPVERDLTAAWDNGQPLFERIWP